MQTELSSVAAALSRMDSVRDDSVWVLTKKRVTAAGGCKLDTLGCWGKSDLKSRCKSLQSFSFYRI
jgi:hypothetical protein